MVGLGQNILDMYVPSLGQAGRKKLHLYMDRRGKNEPVT